jgi:hypothetical protein
MASQPREQRNELQTCHPGRPRSQQGPPARAAAAAVRALRSARGSLLLTKGTASIALDAEQKH